MESLTTSMEQSLRPLNSTRASQEQTVSQLEHMTGQQIHSPITSIGERESSPILNYSVATSLSKSETNSVNPLSSLKSHVKPHVLLEKLLLVPRVLKVSEADIKALCQVVSEFQDQFKTLENLPKNNI